MRLKLQDQPMQILIALLERPNEVVTREELCQRLWGEGTFVDFTHSLNTAVMRLRETLQDTADNPRFIETVPRRGYRFIAPVEDLSAEPPASPAPVESKRRSRIWLVAAAGLLACIALAAIWLYTLPSTIRSVAVLPLENISNDNDQQFFADGVTDELTATLSRISNLRVISRTSAMTYKATRKPLRQIASELGVDAVVEGTVRRSGSRVRITARLVEAATDRSLWTDVFERDSGDILILQSEVARAIANGVRIKLTLQDQQRLAASRPVNPEAHEAYLKGRYYWNRRTEKGLTSAIQYFQQAVNMDPSNALAYSGLADSYALLGSYGIDSTSQIYPLARAAAMKAMELDGSLAETHASYGAVAFFCGWQWLEAEREFQTAISLNPNYSMVHDWYALDLTAMGRRDEALEQIRGARNLDPVSLIINTNVGRILYFNRRYDEAVAAHRKVFELDPDFARGHQRLGMALVAKRDFAGAARELREAVRLDGPDPYIQGLLGYIQAQSGQRTAALSLLEDLKSRPGRQYVPAFATALVYIGLNEPDRAVDWLEKAYDDRSTYLIYAKVDPLLDPVRTNSRFRALLRRMNLPQ